MFQGTQTASSNGSYTPYTGLAAFSIAAVNPNQEEISNIIGREYPYTPEYAKRDFGGVEVQPVTFWVQTEDIKGGLTERITFNLGNLPNKSQSGSIQFVNNKGQFKWAASEEALVANTNNAAFLESGFRVALEGEQEFYSFIQRLIKYKPSAKDAQFLVDCEANGLLAEQIYNGNFEGLKKFVEYCKEKTLKIGLVLSAKEQNKGDGTTSLKQTIITKPESFFGLWSNKVEPYHKERLAEEIKRKEESGYTLSNDIFSIDLMKADDAKSLKKVPENPQSTADDWMPF